ncbi:LLM class flavin-dependent oxidoreductase [Microbacterium sp. CPCC 204701]|uniref:LLM class flavin-dependent oxidoreductase n=1 Tax=Microbacterium sp. CPCC 204701 TaxID=2493084 RepID=UPI000FDAB5F5|nr:LLM class flavin-dependent oxidoreductase [Microbacterium sp. CPCC 204701]
MQIDAVMWPDRRWRDVAGEWRAAEQIGIVRGWVYDHLNLHPRHERWHEATTFLAAVAASTSTVGIGTMVTTPNFRHPALTAKAMLTVQDVAQGRLVVGVGAGGSGADSDALGGTPIGRADRMARFEEWTGQLRELLRRERSNVSGRWTTVVDTRLGGSPAHAPAIAVAATGTKGMRVAAQFADLWITQDVAQDPRVAAATAHAEIARQSLLLDRVCEGIGRDPSSLPRLAVLGYGSERPLASRTAFEDAIDRYAALGISTIAVLWPRGEDADRQLTLLADVLQDANATSGAPGDLP